MANFSLATLKSNDGHATLLNISDQKYLLDDIPEVSEVLKNKSIKQLLDSWDESYAALCNLSQRLVARPSDFDVACVEIDDDEKLDTPIRFPNKVFAVGANYYGHLVEMGLEPAKFVPMPYFFRPPTTSLVGPGKTVKKPRSTEQLDWELEVVVVMGRRLRHAETQDAAWSAIAGYTIGLDLSCRDLQSVKHIGMDIGRGKGQDTLAPVGPIFVPKQCVQKAIGQLDMKLFVNGKQMMGGNTSEMLYNPAEQICEISRYTTLEPGDLIFTGTPAGSAKAHGDAWLQVGDKIRAEIECLGSLEVEITEDT